MSNKDGGTLHGLGRRKAEKKPAYELGADLSELSVKELDDYLALLATERQRVEAMLAKKKATQQAAHSVFKI